MAEITKKMELNNVQKNITELFTVILINVGAWFAPVEATLKVLVLISTLIFTIVQTVNVIIVIRKRRADARNKTDKS